MGAFSKEYLVGSVVCVGFRMDEIKDGPTGDGHEWSSNQASSHVSTSTSRLPDSPFPGDDDLFPSFLTFVEDLSAYLPSTDEFDYKPSNEKELQVSTSPEPSGSSSPDDLFPSWLAHFEDLSAYLPSPLHLPFTDDPKLNCGENPSSTSENSVLTQISPSTSKFVSNRRKRSFPFSSNLESSQTSTSSSSGSVWKNVNERYPPTVSNSVTIYKTGHGLVLMKEIARKSRANYPWFTPKQYVNLEKNTVTLFAENYREVDLPLPRCGDQDKLYGESFEASVWEGSDSVKPEYVYIAESDGGPPTLTYLHEYRKFNLPILAQSPASGLLFPNALSLDHKWTSSKEISNDRVCGRVTIYNTLRGPSLFTEMAPTAVRRTSSWFVPKQHVSKFPKAEVTLFAEDDHEIKIPMPSTKKPTPLRVSAFEYELFHNGVRINPTKVAIKNAKKNPFLSYLPNSNSEDTVEVDILPRLPMLFARSSKLALSKGESGFGWRMPDPSSEDKVTGRVTIYDAQQGVVMCREKCQERLGTNPWFVPKQKINVKENTVTIFATDDRQIEIPYPRHQVICRLEEKKFAHKLFHGDQLITTKRVAVEVTDSGPLLTYTCDSGDSVRAPLLPFSDIPNRLQ